MPFKGKFEDALKRLEEIVQILESGEKSLEESIKIYEEGMELITFCNNKLNEAEKKVKKLSKDTEGNFQLELL